MLVFGPLVLKCFCESAFRSFIHEAICLLFYHDLLGSEFVCSILRMKRENSELYSRF